MQRIEAVDWQIGREDPTEPGQSAGSIRLRLYSGSVEILERCIEVATKQQVSFDLVAFDPHPWGIRLRDGDSLPQLDARLTVYFDQDDLPASVSVEPPGALTSEFLRRFPWGRWIRTAEALWRTSEETEGLSVVQHALASQQPPRRPGRTGYPDEHWEAVAAAYRDLAATGQKNPTALIAELWDIPRNTAAGWVRRCRGLGLLPPARPGRAR